jgi:hypothetical protein
MAMSPLQQEARTDALARRCDYQPGRVSRLTANARLAPWDPPIARRPAWSAQQLRNRFAFDFRWLLSSDCLRVGGSANREHSLVRVCLAGEIDEDVVIAGLHAVCEA